jgi:ribosomal protein S18 acetylase RimI-like enzyme
MNENFHFRKITNDDWLSFKELEDDAFPRDQLERNDFDQLTSSDRFIGYFNNDKPSELIGYLVLTTYDSYAHLNRIGINRNWRGKGYGKILMDYAIKHFLKFNPKEIGIYVETNNSVAISLYEKFGFVKKFESWHYIINLTNFDRSMSDQINLKDYELRDIDVNDLKIISQKFSNFNYAEMKKGFETDQLNENPRFNFLVLLYKGEYVGFTRFSPNFSGSRPFHYSLLNHIDPFVMLLKKYIQPDKDYLRITFDAYDELANLFETRGYTKHHHLFKLIKPV